MVRLYRIVGGIFFAIFAPAAVASVVRKRSSATLEIANVGIQRASRALPSALARTAAVAMMPPLSRECWPLPPRPCLIDLRVAPSPRSSSTSETVHARL